MNKLKIAITKGRLLEKSARMFELAGIECSSILSPGRQLLLPIGSGEMEAVLAKAPDVITYVEHGVCDLGIVGKDTIIEHATNLYEILDLGFGRCRFAVAGPRDTDFFTCGDRRVVATKYINVSKRYLEKKQIDAELIKIDGSVELAPLLGLSDVIIDIVETGSTLKANGLEILEEVCPVSARLVVNTAALKLRKKEIEALVSKLAAAAAEMEKKK
ncbi:MAG: ATP phosphoribosyltransferase [Ruminococcaceae bacterium]|nr:ATP phosphoribosyltransferase [Oscillospiraceae bacterium]